MECFDISNISTTHIVASMVCFLDGTPGERSNTAATASGPSRARTTSRAWPRSSAGATARVLREIADRSSECRFAEARNRRIDYSGFAGRRLREIATRSRSSRPRHPPSAIRLPDLVIVDGGKGQLSSACRELQRLGLHELPIIGLAKEFEEIYRPGRPQPLLLPHDSGALKLLQRIRDEAHRFANGYHQLLMKRRIAESLLDDCPGVSQHRKQILLQHFGSVARLRRASVEEIAAIEGIGRKLAEQVATFLAERA